MATPMDTFAGGATFAGPVVCPQLYVNSGTIDDNMVAANANIAATKLQHQHQIVRSLANHGATPSAVRQVLARIYGATGTLFSFRAGLVTALTVGSATVDLYKNGSSILTGTVSLTTSGGSGGTNYDTVAGVLSSASVVAGDVLEVVGTVSTPTGGGGWYVFLGWREDAA